MNRVELLAPAGNREAFLGALHAGADAVYLGGPKFGARAYADNFSEEDLVQTIRDAHVFGVRIYMTTNTLTREEELPDLLDLVERMYEAGLDGVIVQDLGVIKALRDRCPGLLLHASTQNSVTNSYSVRFLKRMGVSRVVPAREISLEEMKRIKAEEDIEIESFIHGAMCYAYSGRCLMSSFLGGRSGNRGRCAGTCRLPYEILDDQHRAQTEGEVYPLSMKDMCVLEILPELIEAGINSFKIEGRMKRPEFAAGTTAIYRKYIDRYYDWAAKGKPGEWKIDKKDLSDLLSLYIRSDLSTGYYHQRNGKELLTMGKGGYLGAEDALLERINQKYLQERRQLGIEGNAVFMPGSNMELTVSAKEEETGNVTSVTVTGGEVQTASKRPMTEDDLREKLQKTGGTNFVFKALDIETNGNAFAPVGAINALRRDALEALEQKITQDYQERMRAQALKEHEEAEASSAKYDRPHEALEPLNGVLALVMTKDQLDAAMKSDVTTIILDGTLTEPLDENLVFAAKETGKEILVSLPYIFRDSSRNALEKLADKAASFGLSFYARTLEEIEFLREREYDGRVIADSSLYHWNTVSERVLLASCDQLVLPLELTGREMKDTFRENASTREILPVYGRTPLMITAGCIRKTTGHCEHKEDGFWYLKDRYKAEFPVRTNCAHCSNIIFNSVPTSLHKFYEGAQFEAPLHASAVVCMFTDEDWKTTKDILSFYTHPSREGMGAITRALDADFTNGHFKKGAI